MRTAAGMPCFAAMNVPGHSTLRADLLPHIEEQGRRKVGGRIHQCNLQREPLQDLIFMHTGHRRDLMVA